MLRAAHGKLSSISHFEINVVHKKEQIASVQFKIPATVVSTQLDEEVVLLNTITGQYFGVSGIGVELWALLQDETHIEPVVTKLLDVYAVDETVLRKDVEDWLQRLQEQGLLEPVNE